MGKNKVNVEVSLVGKLHIGIERGMKPSQWEPTEKFEKYFVRGMVPQGPVIKVIQRRKGRGTEKATTSKKIKDYSPEQKQAFKERKLAIAGALQDVSVSIGRPVNAPFIKPSLLGAETVGKETKLDWGKAGALKVLRKKDTDRTKDFDAIFHAIKAGATDAQNIACLAVRRAAEVTAKRQVRTLREMTDRHGVVYKGVLRKSWTAEVRFESRKSGAVIYNEIVVDIQNKALHSGPVLRGSNPKTVWSDIDKLEKWVLAKGLRPRLRKRRPRIGIDQNPQERIVPKYQKRERYVRAIARAVRYYIWINGMKPSKGAVALQQDVSNVGRNVLNSIYSQALKKDEKGMPIGSAYKFAVRQALRAAKALDIKRAKDAERQAEFRKAKKAKIIVSDS